MRGMNHKRHVMLTLSSANSELRQNGCDYSHIKMSQAPAWRLPGLMMPYIWSHFRFFLSNFDPFYLSRTHRGFYMLLISSPANYLHLFTCLIPGVCRMCQDASAPSCRLSLWSSLDSRFHRLLLKFLMEFLQTIFLTFHDRMWWIEVIRKGLLAVSSKGIEGKEDWPCSVWDSGTFYLFFIVQSIKISPVF